MTWSFKGDTVYTPPCHFSFLWQFTAVYCHEHSRDGWLFIQIIISTSLLLMWNAMRLALVSFLLFCLWSQGKVAVDFQVFAYLCRSQSWVNVASVLVGKMPRSFFLTHAVHNPTRPDQTVERRHIVNIMFRSVCIKYGRLLLLLANSSIRGLWMTRQVLHSDMHDISKSMLR